MKHVKNLAVLMGKNNVVIICKNDEAHIPASSKQCPILITMGYPGVSSLPPIHVEKKFGLSTTYTTRQRHVQRHKKVPSINGEKESDQSMERKK